MTKFRLGYLDEDDSDIQRFYDFIKPFPAYEFCDFKPLDSIEELVDSLMDEHLDSIVVDYQINEYAAIGYNGLEVIDLIKARRKDFPCILLTSHTNDAISESFDTNIVYPKSIPFEDDADAKNMFELKIRMSIEHYKSAIDRCSNELAHLCELDTPSLQQEARMIEIDNFLETNLSNGHSVPSHLKGSAHIESIKNLVSKTDALIKKLDECDVSNKKV